MTDLPIPVDPIEGRIELVKLKGEKNIFVYVNGIYIGQLQSELFDDEIVPMIEMVKAPTTQRCETLFYSIESEEYYCDKPAAFIVDNGKHHAYKICDDCAKDAHPSRLTPIALSISRNNPDRALK